MINKISKMKNTLHKINNRLNTAKGNIHEPEEIAVELSKH